MSYETIEKGIEEQTKAKAIRTFRLSKSFNFEDLNKAYKTIKNNIKKRISKVNKTVRRTDFPFWK